VFPRFHHIYILAAQVVVSYPMYMREHVITQLRKLLDEGREEEIRLYSKKKKELEKKCAYALRKLRKKFKIKATRGMRFD